MSDLDRRGWVRVAAPAGLVALLVVGWLVVTVGPRPDGPPGTPEGAAASCREAALARLARPETATFSDVRWDRAGTQWLVSGGLTATTADGERIDGRFDCSAIATSGEVVTLVLPFGL